MQPIERNCHYLIGEIDGALSMHSGRGYFSEKGKYKTTLCIPLDTSSNSTDLYDQLTQFECIYAIDTNKRDFTYGPLTASCAVHLALEYVAPQKWKMTLSRLPAILSCVSSENPELPAWRRLIQSLSPRVQGRIAIVVDSELGNLPLFNRRARPIVDNYLLPDNVQLIYASAERDLSSPLNKAIWQCDKDADQLLKAISQQENFDEIYSKISGVDSVAIQPS